MKPCHVLSLLMTIRVLFQTSVGGSTEELIPGGSQIPVTPENIYKYVKLYAHKVMIGSIESELRAMRHGLHDIIPGEILQNLKAEVTLDNEMM